MSTQSRRVAGAILIIMPTVVIGGVSVLTLLVNGPDYTAGSLRQDLWPAGHAHAGVLLILSLAVLGYVDETDLAERTRWLLRLGFPAAAILLPVAYFLSVLSPAATELNAPVDLDYAGAVVLAAGMVIVGVRLLRTRFGVAEERRVVR